MSHLSLIRCFRYSVRSVRDADLGSSTSDNNAACHAMMTWPLTVSAHSRMSRASTTSDANARPRVSAARSPFLHDQVTSPRPVRLASSLSLPFTGPLSK